MFDMADLERQNFAEALRDPSIDKTQLLAVVTRFERAQRLKHQPEPGAYDIKAAHLLVRIGR